jgi:hypothetical protein
VYNEAAVKVLDLLLMSNACIGSDAISSGRSCEVGMVAWIHGFC